MSGIDLYHPIIICCQLVTTSFWFELVNSNLYAISIFFQDPLHPLVLGGDHSISYPVIRAVSEKLGGPVDILHLDAHPDIYDAFEGNKYSHASSFARIMEGGYARRLLQVNNGYFSFLLAFIVHYVINEDLILCYFILTQII